MGQQANSGRNASLDQKKEHTAGRNARNGQKAPGREAILDASGDPSPTKAKVSGAFGKKGQANRRSS